LFAAVLAYSFKFIQQFTKTQSVKQTLNKFQSVRGLLGTNHLKLVRPIKTISYQIK